MTFTFAVKDRNYLTQHCFEARDKVDAGEMAHNQPLLRNNHPFIQNKPFREEIFFTRAGSLHPILEQLSSQVHSLPPSILNRKLIEDLTQGKPLSSTGISALDTSLVKAMTSNQKHVWFRLGNASLHESTILEFCYSFFTSRPNKEERSIHSFLVLRIIDLTFCRKDVQPTPEFTKEICYLIMCKVQDFVDIQFSKIEEELEEVTVDRRDVGREKLLQTIYKIRETTISLWGKFSAIETRPLLYAEEMRFVKQALNLYETEISYAAALDKVAGKEDYAEELRCMLALGKLYAKKRERQALIQAAGMFTYALRLIEDPQYLPAMQMNTRHIRRAEILHNLGRVEVQLFRLIGIKMASPQEVIERARASILANRENLHEKRKIIDEEIKKLGEEPTPQQIVDVHLLITNNMKVFTAQLIKQCIAILGKAPCHYTVIGLGSMAREEMTHYSDLEFAILIEEGAEQHKEYFRNFTYLLHLKVINLGETILPALNIPCLNSEGGISFFDGVTPRGFAFDGAGVKGKGCKTPLGNGTTFELIQTPTKMVQYLGRDNNTGIDWPQKEPHLPMELLNFALIAGNESLCQSYREALDKELSSPYGEGIDLRNYLARVHLVAEDEQQFDPALDSLEKEGQLFKVKQDLYRFPHLALDRLSILSDLQVLSTVERIKALNYREVLNPTASERVQWLICTVLFQRLKVYSHYKAQQEFMNPLIKAFALEDPQLIQKQFTLDRHALKTLTKIYQILIPFYKAIKAYLREDSFILRAEVLWDESDFTLGEIARRFLQYEQARAYYLKVQDSSLEDKAERLDVLGTVELQLGKAQEALCRFQESLTTLEKIHGKEHLDVAASLNNIGSVYYFLGKAEEALSFHKKALTILEKIYCKEHPRVATSLNNIGSAYNSLGKAEEALSFHQRALTIREKIYGKEHSHVASSLNNIGNVYYSLEKAEEALSYFQRALTVLEKVCGKEHPHVVTSLSSIGSVYHSLGNAKKALLYSQKALTIWEKIYGKENPHVASSLNNIGGIYNSLGNTKKALLYFQKALTIWEKIYEKEHPHVASSLNNIGEVYYHLGSAKKALLYSQKALTILEKIYGDEHPHIVKSRKNVIATTYQTIEHPQQTINFILAEYSKQAGVT